MSMWYLVFYFQMVDAVGLLRIYVDYDLVAEASALLCEYADACMGVSPLAFGLKVWLFGHFCFNQLVIWGK